MTMTGQCLCGQIKYEIKSSQKMMGICHCKNCQRQAGSAFSTLAAVSRSDFNFTAGQPTLYSDSDTNSGNTVKRYFCGHCGSPIYSAISSKAETLHVKAGTLDDTSGFNPQYNIWCDSKQNWVVLQDGVPEMSQGFKGTKNVTK